MLRTVALVTSFMLAMVAPALAEVDGGLAPAEEILSTLRDRGYRILEDERTWLGRQRIIAEKNGAWRELVFNPGTGEILRDYSFRVKTGEGTTGTATGSGTIGAATATTSRPGMSVGDSVDSATVRDLGNTNSQAHE